MTGQANAVHHALLLELAETCRSFAAKAQDADEAADCEHAAAQFERLAAPLDPYVVTDMDR